MNFLISQSQKCRGLVLAATLAAAAPTMFAGRATADSQTSVAAVPTVMPGAASPITSAKTIQLNESFGAPDKDGIFQAGFTMVVDIDRSTGVEKVRIDMPSVRPVPAGKPAPKVSEYLLDGKNEYEYNGLINTYTVKDAPSAGQRSHSQMRDMAAIDLILYPDKSAEAAEVAGITKTVTTATLDGKLMQLTVYSRPPRKGTDGKEFTSVTRLWTDAATGLPYRREDGSVKTGGPTRVFLQTNFSDWKLTGAVAPQRFAWTPPAGSEMYTGPKLLAAGKPAPDFTAYAPDGKAVQLSNYKGKVVILDFWATWCGPCQRSLPHLEKVYAKVKDQDVVVLAVCVWDKKDEYTKWVAAKKGVYSFPTVFDPAGRDKGNIAEGLYKVTGIPTQYVIDKNGNISAGTIGYEEGGHFLEAALGKLGVTVAGATETKTASIK